MTGYVVKDPNGKIHWKSFDEERVEAIAKFRGDFVMDWAYCIEKGCSVLKIDVTIISEDRDVSQRRTKP